MKIMREVRLSATLLFLVLVPLLADADTLDIGVVSREVQLMSGDIKLAGTLILPSCNDACPALVYLLGSGPATRDGGMATHLAELFAKRAGIAGLVYDKRGAGQSEGDWTRASLQDLAFDAVNAMKFLRRQPNIDGDRIGLWGHSQGVWVATVATTLTNDIATLVAVSGGGAAPRESETFAYEMALAHARISDAEKEIALELVDDYFDYLAGKRHRDELVRKIEVAKQSDWYQYVAIDHILVSEENRTNWEWVGVFDPVPIVETMRFPVLVIFGGADHSVPVDLSATRWRQGLTTAGNENYRIEIFPDGNHHLATETAAHQSGGAPNFVDGFLALQTKWMNEWLSVSE